MNQSPLKVEALCKSYGTFKAVKNVNFELKEGEIFGLLGPNGAGKTSIISTIVTLEEPTSGSVSVFGHDVQKNPVDAKYLTGIVPQELISHGFFDVEEILHIYSGFFGLIKNKERVDFLMHKMGLYEHRHKKVRMLSGGMKRRLLVAKSLVHSPRLLLLDEPTAGVDIELRSSLWDYVRELKKDGVTILLTTHYLEEAEELCDRVGILSLGEIKKIGPTNELIQELTQRKVKFFLRERREINHPLLIEKDNSNLVFQIPYSMTIAELFKDLNLSLDEVKGLQIAEGTLEDAFVHILGENNAISN